jgi:hypothetical protein
MGERFRIYRIDEPKQNLIHLCFLLLVRDSCKNQWQYRGVAQLVAHLFWEQRVAGSNPVSPIHFSSCRSEYLILSTEPLLASETFGSLTRSLLVNFIPAQS